MLNVPPRNRSVVLEYHQPPLLHGLLQNASLGFESNQRLDVVAHDPRQRQMGMRRDEIAQIERALAG